MPTSTRPNWSGCRLQKLHRTQSIFQPCFSLVHVNDSAFNVYPRTLSQLTGSPFHISDSTYTLEQTLQLQFSMSNTEPPRVGVGVFILNSSGGFIFGKRLGSHGAGTWALPGGHLEFGESFEDCARREVLEETGLEIVDLRFLTAVNSVLPEGKHYVTIFMVCRRRDNKEPQLLEPHKCEGWRWMQWETMLEWYRQGGSTGDSQNLFLPMSSLVEQRPDITPVL